VKTPARLLIAAAAAPVLFCGVAFSANAATTPSAVTPMAVANNVTPNLASAHNLGALAANRQLTVSVSLKLRNADQLHQFLAAVADPHSPQYRHYLTPAQFAAQYGPTQASVDAVVAHLKANGLKVTQVSANRQDVEASGPASAMQQAFGTSINSYYDASQNRTFYANATAPQLPADVADVVQGVAGLDNHYLPHHDSVASPNSGIYGLWPSDLRAAYDVPASATGAGETVGLWEFDGFVQSDINAFDKKFGITASAPTVEKVDGGQGTPTSGGQTEVDLDIEAIQGMAPGASQIVYEAPEPSSNASFEQEEIDEANQIVSDDSVQVVSMSWGMCEASRTAATMQSADNAFAQGAAEGIGWYAASGDSGSADCSLRRTGVDFPASDPNVTGVGGTTLTVSGGGYGGETAWSGSGGGVSTVFSAPSYQAGSGGKETVPDVAADADPSSGLTIYSGGRWGGVGGTSLAAPLWASFATLYDQTTGGDLGSANAQLYAAAGSGSGFHDITSGNNGGFTAGPGYDEVTGNGSYDFTALTAALGG
jgi:subtilase family serine protease